MPYTPVIPVFDSKMRALCARPYPGHPKGCPNFGKKTGCPPEAPLLGQVFDLTRECYLVWNEFDLAAHVSRMRHAHPDWTDRQLTNCLYWQPGARKALNEMVDRFWGRFEGMGIERCPEALGLNVTETLKRAGVEMEWPPVTKALQVAFVGWPLDGNPLCGGRLQSERSGERKRSEKARTENGKEDEMDRATLYKKVAEASATGGGNNLRDGRGRLCIKKLSLEDGFQGARFVGELVVVSSQKIPVTELKTGRPLDIEPNPAGGEVSWVQLFDKHPTAFGAVKGFLLSLFNVAESETDPKDIVETMAEVTEKNSAEGMVIDYATYRRVTDKNGVEIVLPKWSHVEQTPEDVARMRKWLGSLVISQQAAMASGASAAA